jgi:hypothetical protein
LFRVAVVPLVLVRLVRVRLVRAAAAEPPQLVVGLGFSLVQRVQLLVACVIVVSELLIVVNVGHNAGPLAANRP